MTPIVQQCSLKSSNPILSRPQFGRRGGQKTAVRDQRAGIPVARDRIGAGTDLEAAPSHDPAPPPLVVGDLMTMGGVLSRAAAGLGVTSLMAVLSWALLPLVPAGAAASYGIAGGAGLLAAALVLVQRRRNLPSPVRTLTFAALQGVFLGVLSATASSHLSPGVFVQTVLGTMAAGAGVLLAHTLHWLRAHRRFPGFTGAALLAAALLAFTDWLLLDPLGARGLGLRPFGLGVVMGVVGVILGTVFLALHLRQVENGIVHGTSRDHSWTAAFGVTLTLAWLYVETVRLLTLCPGDDFY
ncbi:Bax inhibitor-1/YccA family membrane protein [Streptomyces olivaceoviridis]|uniref:Bax inhibitor-1/YccA family membrane protein n=1 Tax=Streptomyces olivaceoviridis TaxID=1921 RepID=UPI0036F5DB85